jgi:uncharacterized protein
VILAALARRLAGLHQLEVTRHAVYVPGLARRVTAAHLTDFHCDEVVTSRYLRELVERTNALEPDLALLTGDYASRGTGRLEECLTALSGLRAPLGRFAVLGNHDHANGAAEARAGLAAHGFRELMNESVEVQGGLWLVGVDDCYDGRPDVPRAFSAVPAGATPIVLTHVPRLALRLVGSPVVILSGDTHGGQVYVPGLTQRLLPGTRTFCRGWYRVAEGLVFVNRGIGTMKAPVRFNARPEIALITFIPTDGPLTLE